LKSTFNAENFIRRLSWSFLAILAQFTLEIRVAARNREKFTIILGGSRSFMVIDVDIPIPKKLVASACYDKQHVCVHTLVCVYPQPCIFTLDEPIVVE